MVDTVTFHSKHAEICAEFLVKALLGISQTETEVLSPVLVSLWHKSRSESCLQKMGDRRIAGCLPRVSILYN
jgi:hypothetical protein